MPLGSRLELDEVPGTVVVDVVTGADARGLAGPVVVHRDLPAAAHHGGGGGGGPPGGGEHHGRLPLRHLEYHLHVVSGAEPACSPVEIFPGGGGDEIVILTGSELQPPRGGAEVPEGDGEVLELLGFVADGHNLGSLITDPAGLELVLTDAVDDVLLCRVLGTDEVQLVVLPGQVAHVHINHIVRVVQPEDGVGRVPEHEVGLDGCGSEAEGREDQDRGEDHAGHGELS